MYTIRQATVGFQDVQFSGDIASFSHLIFQVFSFLQLTVAIFFATLFTAAGVAQERDRRTLLLLLMTDMRNHELALGKLCSSLLIVIVLLAASVPVFASLRLLGGVTWQQIVQAELIIASAALASGSWGCLVAFWRQKTFQILAISVLGIVFSLATVEGILAVAGPDSALHTWLSAASPLRALFHVLNPLAAAAEGIRTEKAATASILIFLGTTVVLSAVTICRLRVWNPSRSVHRLTAENDADQSKDTAPRQVHHRSVWNNPVLWKEIATRGYGRRVIWVRVAYLVLIIGIGQAIASADTDTLVLGMVSPAGFGFLGSAVLSLLLINTQAVTSITTERDMNTLDILLATDLSPREFMIGKIVGAAWNTKEMILAPLMLLTWTAGRGLVTGMTAETVVYLVIGYLVLCLFAIVLGLHSGLTRMDSRSAVASSLGTMFFLFVGIFVFMLLLVEARSSFAIQMQSFIVFIGLGSLGLYGSMTYGNPSSALTLASLLLPFLTFYSITDFLLGGTLGVFLWICVAYGFASVAMLVPTVSDFDIALGRSSNDG